MSDEFFRQENPSETEDDLGSGGGGGGIGGGWGGGGGGDWGGMIWGEDSGWGDGSGGGESEEEIPTEWGDDRINQPFLRYLAGYMIVDKKDGLLLTGSLPCGIPPSIVIRGIDNFPRDEEGEPEDTLDKHIDCVLFKLDPIDPPDHDAAKRLRDDGEYENMDPLEDVMRTEWLSFCDPGSYTVSLKWQAGHHDYSICNQLAVDLWGVSTGFRQFPLTEGNWVKVFSVTVTDEFSVIVNQRPGDVRANSKFFTEKKDDE